MGAISMVDDYDLGIALKRITDLEVIVQGLVEYLRAQAHHSAVSALKLESFLEGFNAQKGGA